MFAFIFLLFGVTQFSTTGCAPGEVYSTAEPVSHQLWTDLLQKHVSPDGSVDYNGFKKDMAKLKEYTSLLAANHPNSSWSDAEQMAYWINAYNAFTIQLVAEHYPLESIKDIKRGIPMVNTVWDIKFIEIGGQKYDLNKIEHGILRKDWDEPRIHFAVNCASISCPNLRNEAFTADKLESQLTEQTRLFLADENKNRISKNKVEVSRLFQWFGGDFKKKGTLIDFLNQYTDMQIASKADVKYLKYDWGIND